MTIKQTEPMAHSKNKRVVVLLIGTVCLMGGLSFASVPLYRLFCQVTGFAGTPRVAAEASFADAMPVTRPMQVRFDSSVSQQLHWSFRPMQQTISMRAGERILAFYEAENIGQEESVGHAIFNVTPLKAAQYFVKVDCFCFQNQRLAAGKKIVMPVAFYIDPAIDNDESVDDVSVITLSYTFYASDLSDEDYVSNEEKK